VKKGRGYYGGYFFGNKWHDNIASYNAKAQQLLSFLMLYDVVKHQNM
jgi:hypothetical protein